MADHVPVGPNPFARMHYFQAVSRCAPEALRETLVIDADDTDAWRAWADRRGFTDGWALRAVRLHQIWWRGEPERVGIWLAAGTVGYWAPTLPAPPGWDIVFETEDVYRARVETYIAAMKGVVTRTPEKFGLHHFDWTALYQVAGLSQSEIQNQLTGVDTPTPELASIGEGIHSVAELIGLTLRAPRLGRPKKV